MPENAKLNPFPPVSVVVPARNAEQTIRETLASVCKCRHVTQIIVVDDQSTDNTRRICLSFGDDRLRVVEGPGTGISGALNAGFEAVEAPYVMRCDADDIIPSDRLDWQVSYLESDPGLIAVSAGFATMLEDGTPCGWLACAGEVRDATQVLLSGQTLTSFCTWLTRTAAVRAVGGARDWFRTAEDVDLQLRLATVGRVLHVPQVSYVYRMHDSSIVHVTSNSARFFFDRHAEEFLANRLKTGSDALDRGEPLPEWPDHKFGKTRTALEQGIGHAISAAWTEAKRGEHRSALARLGRLLKRAPATRELWVHALKIGLHKILMGRRRKAGNPD